MTTLHFKIGEHIPTLGKIKEIHFENLFNFKFNINDDLYELKELIKALSKRRVPIINRLKYVLKTNTSLAFAFLKTRIIKCEDLEKVTELMQILNNLWNLIDAENFNFDNYYDEEKAKDLLIQFWTSYDKK